MRPGADETREERTSALEFLKVHTRAIVIGSIFMAIVVLISLVTYISLNQWRNNVIRTNETLTSVVAEQLYNSAQNVIDSLAHAKLLNRESLTMDEAQKLDLRLKKLSDSVFAQVPGMEGGFFLSNLDEFYGYSYPTSPPPVPVYGPPPRSYSLIKEQVLESIETGKSIVRLHGFDPAIFPLATKPLRINDATVATVWARIHIERELPAIKLRQVTNVGAVISLLGFIIAMLISVTQRRKILRMRYDLDQVKSGKRTQITQEKGTLGVIARSINAMVRTMRDENARREDLERELHQKEKMASLGRVIAGVAHEVKTPLAIIKTRIQMWQQALRGEPKENGSREVFSNESLQLVVDEVDRLSDLVKRLLLFSKPQPTVMEATDVNALLKQTVSFSESRSAKKKIDVQCEFDERLPKVEADRNALRQVFINVFVNSIEAINRTGKIDVKTRFDQKSNRCIIEVRDTGSGIPRELTRNIFDPFVTTKRKGFGLGLAISYEIVSSHGGSIQLAPQAGGGTVCTIELPISQRERD